MGAEHTPEYNKTLLSANNLNIKNIFELFKTRKNFMGVYFTDIDKPFLTFKDVYADFTNTVKISKRVHCLGYIYNTSQDFDVQTATFLA